MSFHRIALACALVMVSIGAQARQKQEPLVQVDPEAPVAEQLERVERALMGNDYSELSMEDRAKVQSALDRIRRHMGEHAQVAELSLQGRTDVHNDQELINTLLTRAHADSRMVCRSEYPTGSNRRQQVCMTVAQRRESAENAHNLLLNQQRSMGRIDNP